MEPDRRENPAWRTWFFAFATRRRWKAWTSLPFDSEFGQKIYKNVSKAAWDEWVDRQKMLLNEYRLQPWTPQAQQFLVEQMEEFFFGEGSALPRNTFRHRTDGQGRAQRIGDEPCLDRYHLRMNRLRGKLPGSRWCKLIKTP